MTGGAGTAQYPPLIAGLLRPEAYPHTVHEPVRVAETHISWVLLTGEFAYKVKKPLRLSFLDYSTPERRRALCEEEVRLNRRHAPGLYLGVSAITGSDASPRVDGSGPVLEHAVRMRQFDARDELTALLAAGSVTAADMAALGADIAGLHAAAAAAPADGAFGDPERVHRVTLDNFAELRRLPEAASWQQLLHALEARLTALLERDRSLMNARRAQGRVRECHGDLHCGNVVRWQGRLTPFDGIEFEPALRYVDVANDVAFLTMDLVERGHAALHRAVLQAWLEALGDCEALRLLPYYEAYRALVRAKVAALRALQEEPGSASRAATVATCDRYVSWAVERVRERRPALVLTCGLSGSGKTWLARQLAPRLGALHLRSDVERKRLAGLAAHEDSLSAPDAGIYTREFNDRTYARLHDCAAAALEAGEHVIVDAAFLRRGERLRFLELAATGTAPAAIVRCHAPEAVLRERVAARTAARSDASEAGLAVLARQPGYWEPFDAREQPFVIAVDTSVPAAVDAALERLTALAGR